MSRRLFFVLAPVALAFNFVQAQQAPVPQPSMPGMDMSSHDHSSDQGMKGAESEASDHAMHSMEGHHMDMGPHMKMTELQDPKPGDAERAQKVLEAARVVMMRYRDYHSALDEGFRIFHPELPQKMYHFTNYKWAAEAEFSFNPDHPTSLLYEKHGDSYTLVGIMYTAPKRYTEADLDQRIPLSVAQWHEHINFCKAPADRWRESLPPNPKFGFNGSISTQEACDAAGGTFKPLVFNWMVHLYPDEKANAEIWDASRGHSHNHAD
jgi:hypothetical protein